MSETDVEFVFLISTLGRVRGETVVVSEPDQIRFLDSFQYAYRTKVAKVDKVDRVDDKSVVEVVEVVEVAENAAETEGFIEVVDEPIVESIDESVNGIHISEDGLYQPRKKRSS